MAEISLKEYHQKLEALLKANQVDETIHHCRHILQYFPRNAATYRYLGRALLASGSLSEAAEVFRRVLSVYPDDITAHTSLAAVYRQKGQYDAAIWHLERAYEQDTANLEYQEALRELYRQQRGVEQTRLQLTAAAAARHYVSSGLHDQAVRTLQEALAAAPQRADLRLLLARTLSESGQSVESAEAALDTLEALPDCLEANRIMARFWLSEQRPSDAQRYVSRIEALDPYEAYLIAQGGPPPETAFTLLELDYGRVVKRRLATETPDWLEAIDAAPAEAAEAAPAPAADSDLPEWLFGGDSLSLDDAFGAPKPAEAGVSGALPAFDDEPSAVEEAQPVARTGFTGMLAALDHSVTAAGAEEAAAEADEPLLEGGELADWLLEAAPPEVAGAAADDASAAWLDELPAAPDEFGLLADVPAAGERPDPTADPLAWLQGSGIELTDEGAGVPAPAPDEEDMVYGDPGAAAARPYADADDDAALDWLSDEALLEELLDLEAMVDQPEAAADLPDAPAGWAGMTDVLPGRDSAPLAAEQPEDSPVLDHESDWQTKMPDNDQQLPDWLQPEADEPDPPESAFDWLDEVLSEAGGDEAPAGDEQFEWLAGIPDEPEAPQPAAADTTPDWLGGTAQTSPLRPEMLAGLDDSALSGWPSGEDQPEWLAQVTGGAGPPAPAEPEADSSAALGWMAGEAAGAEAAAPWASAVDAEPEWLAQLAGGAEPETPPPPVPEAEAADSFDWIAEVGAAAEAEPAAADIPEWLTEAAPLAAEEAAHAPEEEAAADEAFAWAFEAEPAAADIPEWLAEAAPQAAEEAARAPEEEAAADEAFAWEMAARAEPAAADIPEWLTEAAPLAADQPAYASAGDEAFAWEAEQEMEAGFAPADEVEPADTAQLSEQPQADVEPWEEGAAEAIPLAERDYYAVVEEGPEVPAEAGEPPEWLGAIASSAAAPPEETEPDYIFEPVRSEFGWLEEVSEAAAAADEEALAAEAEAGEAETSEAGAWPGAAAAAGAFAWMATYDEEQGEAEPAQPAEAGVPEAIDWLAEHKPAAEEPAYGFEVAAPLQTHILDADDWPTAPEPAYGFEAETAAPAETDDWPPADTDDAELERLYAAAHRPPPADNAPEWLNNMVPGLELDYAAEEDEPLESAYTERRLAAAGGDFDWLNRIVDEETGSMLAIGAAAAAGLPRQPRFVFTREPAWLRRPASRPDAEPADSSDDDFELPDWLR